MPKSHTYAQSKLKPKFTITRDSLNNSDEIGFTNSEKLSLPFLSTNSNSNSNSNSQTNSRSDLLSHKDSSETVPSRKCSKADEDYVITDVTIVDTRKQSDNYLVSYTEYKIETV